MKQIDHELEIPSLLNYRQHNYTYLKKYVYTQTHHPLKNIEFDSHFESSNLLWVYECLSCPNTYYLFVESDTSSQGYNQWFYFAVTGIKKNTVYRMVVLNMVSHISVRASASASTSMECSL